MLRNVLIGLFALALILVVWAALFTHLPLYGPIFILALCLAGFVFERFRYGRTTNQRPDTRFQPTPEKFIDPETNKPVTVYVDPATGERRYVNDSAA